MALGHERQYLPYPRHGNYRERHPKHYDHQQAKKQATARKVADAPKRHALEAEELAGLSAVKHFTAQEGADNEQRFDAFVLAALSHLTRRVEELEKQLQALREHTDASEFDEDMLTIPPEQQEGAADSVGAESGSDEAAEDAEIGDDDEEQKQ